MGNRTTPAGVNNLFAISIGWGFVDALIAYIDRGNFTSWVFLLLGTLTIGVVGLIQKQKFDFKLFLHTFPLGIWTFASTFLIFTAFVKDNPSNVIAVLSFATVLSIVIFAKRFDEKVTVMIYVLTFIGVIGVLMTSLKSIDSLKLTSGSIYTLICLPISTVGTFVHRENLKRNSPTMSAFYKYLWAAILFSFIVPFINSDFTVTKKEVILLILISTIAPLGHILYSYSQNQTSYIANVLISNAHTPATAFFTFIIAKQSLKIHQVIGIVITIAVVIVVTILQYKNNPKDQQLTDIAQV